MLEFHERRRFRKILYSKPTAMVLVVLMALLGLAAVRAYGVSRGVASHTELLKAELAELRIREASLESEIERLSTDRGVESEIRSKFDVAKLGEHVVVIVDPQPEDAVQVEYTPSFWERVKGWF